MYDNSVTFTFFQDKLGTSYANGYTNSHKLQETSCHHSDKKPISDISSKHQATSEDQSKYVKCCNTALQCLHAGLQYTSLGYQEGSWDVSVDTLHAVVFEREQAI